MSIPAGSPRSFRNRTSGGGERGSVTAELAVALPAVVLVLVLAIGALSAGAAHVRLQDGAADAARLVARDEPEGRASGVVARAVTGATMGVEHRGDLVCVTATSSVSVGPVTVPLRAVSCALAGGL